MKHILTSVFLIVLLFPALAFGEMVTRGNLVIREGLFYKKFADVPFTGKITGKFQGSLKDGKRHGPWVFHKEDGTKNELSTGTYKDGVKVE